MVKYVCGFVGGVGGKVLIAGLQDGVTDVGVLDFIAGSQDNGEFLVDVDFHAEACFAHRASFRAVNHAVHFLGYGGDIPFEAVPQVGVEQRNEFGVSEVPNWK